MLSLMIVTISADPSPECRERLDAIEDAADALFHRHGIRFSEPARDAAAPLSGVGYFAIATEEASDRAVGFARVIEDEGFAHLEQLSVHPDHARRGHGRALVDAAISEAAKRGYPDMTLRTYDRIPWNRPFYESCGFRVIAAPEAPFFARILAEEEERGLADHGKRVFMRVSTTAATG